MDRRKKDRFSPPVVGGTSLLGAFAVLTLTVFALLSLSTVQADVRLADKSAQAVTDYYAADTKAQEILARIRGGEEVEEVEELETEDGAAVLCYTVPVSDTQELYVEVSPEADGTYRVLVWQTVPIGEWEADESLDLWDGMFF